MPKPLGSLILIFFSGVLFHSYLHAQILVVASLSQPAGIAEDSAGNILVTEFQRHHIIIYDKDWKFISTFGVRGEENGQLVSPAGITVDKKAGKIYVSDAGNNRIQVFSQSGAYLSQFKNNFSNPAGIAINSKGEIFIVDSGNHCIKVFNEAGKFLRKFGSFGSKPGQFYYPQRLAFNRSEQIFIADTYNNRIQIFNTDEKYLTQIKNFGSKNEPLSYPIGIAIDKSGKIYISDNHNYRVHVFSKNYHFIKSIGKFGYNENEFSDPREIKIIHNRLFLCDHSQIMEIFGDGIQGLKFNKTEDLNEFSSPFILAATSNTKLPVSFASSDKNVASISNDVVTVMGIGRATLFAYQAGDIDFAPAVVNQNLNVISIWQSWWFISTSFIFCVAMIYIGLAMRNRAFRKKEYQKLETSKRIVQLQMIAMKAQINPHFIFNCLNTINSYIVKSDAALASDYLARFAKLIRLVLENSETNLIPLRKELEIIEMYLSLEVIRFGPKIDYEIVNHGINEDFEVPSMCLQPFIENAIWHGLLHKKENGKIKIEILPWKRGVKCIIEDNGIGRENAHKLGTSSRKSFGVNNTKERLSLLNKDNEVNIIDLFNDSLQAAGTKIEIIFKR